VKKKNPSKDRPLKIVKSDNPLPVVGIGASAGGLDAFKSFLKSVSEDSGMAYILVQHLDPKHESLLPEILQKVTHLPVQEISEELKFEPNHVYVMPSNKILIAKDGDLLLSPRPEKIKNERNLSIDLLFTSLAETHHEYAVGVVLSGTATDGTLGLKTIKGHGGITFAQDMESAEYNGMPWSAIQAGVVDFILPPQDIPAKLLEVASIINTTDTKEQVKQLGDKDILRQILFLLRVRKGVDFSHYKQTTIRRRILRRMGLSNITKAADYLAYLRGNSKEQDVLFQDFLIPVTGFFRDPEIFNDLCKTILPLLKKGKHFGEAIRVWVAGCSTGEEAYSIAMCLMELLGRKSASDFKNKVQIFASDLSESAIEKARLGIYSEHELAGVSKKRQKDFFTKNNGRYQVNREIRDMCVFAVHNFLKDPPFGKIDLLSCRNVLIYMEPYLQKQALTTFHYAINPGGYLFLGKTETTSGVSELFASSLKSDRIYIRKDVPSKFMHVVSLRSEKNYTQADEKPKPESTQADYQKMADQIMLSKYTPPGVVVNGSMDIVQFRGKTGNYLEQAPGKPSHNLIVMAKEGLAFELRNIIQKVKKEIAPVIKKNILLKENQEMRNISIEAIPLPNTIEPYYLVLFHDKKTDNSLLSSETGKKKSDKSTPDEKDLRIRQLEQELMETREDMRNMIKEQEAFNEELQSANEELMSSSEELQSLNEELETSKEELQSTNEELIVVNHEMISLNEQISEERNYSQSIVANLREPLLVLDENLRVRTANNAFYKVFATTEEETEGTLVYDLGNRQWDIPELRTLLEKVIPEKSIINDFQVTHNFPNIGELILLINAREVMSESSKEKLILLSIEDVTEKVIEKRKNLEIQERHTKELEEKIRERTIELKNANKELLQKNEDLINMNMELEAFAYVSSHDLQEPLRKIQTFAGRILEKEIQNLSDKGKTYFRLMQDAANRMQKLIEDLLDFSRLATVERKFETTDLNNIIEEVKLGLKLHIEEKKAIIDTDSHCEASIIVFQFRQLIQNLITNALKFSKPGVPPHITIKCKIIKGKDVPVKKLASTRNYCHISVTDKGMGFDNKFREKIFEVFQKLHGKDEYPGTGIGLATVKKIVDNHNGAVSATSKPDKGATFDIYIPVRQ